MEGGKISLVMGGSITFTGLDEIGEAHSSKNLLLTEIDPRKSWLCEKGTPKGIVLLQLECPTVITAVRIGNANSAFIEILVGRVGDPTDSFETLVPSSMFMNMYESKSGTKPDQVKFFYQKDFCASVSAKEWDVVKVVCTQPFNNQVPYGICFIRVTGLGDELRVLPENVEKQHQKQNRPPISNQLFKKKGKTSLDEDPRREIKEQIESKNASSSLAKNKSESLKQRIRCAKESRGKRKKKDENNSPNKKLNNDRGLAETSPKVQLMNEEDDNDDDEKEEEEEDDDDDDDDDDKVKRRKITCREERKLEVTEAIRKTNCSKKDRRDMRKRRRKRSVRGRPFGKLMEDVSFVISGFKNPARRDLRNQALEMGATYSADWDSRCTHLICSYRKTPKYNEVKGKGRIVRKEWVEACYRDRKRYPWRRYALDVEETRIGESEEEITAVDGRSSSDEGGREEEGSARPRRSVKKVECSSRLPESHCLEEDYVLQTDDEKYEKMDTTDFPMPHLSDLFSGKTFYVDRGLESWSQIERYIIAYDGKVADTINEDVEFYITNTGGGAVFKIFRNRAPKLRAIKPDWIWEVNSKCKWISPWTFMFS